MTLWMVRAGKYGERESYNFDQGYATIGFRKLPDLSSISKKSQLEDIYLHSIFSIK